MSSPEPMKFYLFVSGIFCSIFISRLYLVHDGFNSLDSVLYAIGSVRYSIADYTPPSPGYFLYVMSGHVLNYFFQSPFDSLVFLSVFYSGGIGVVLFLLARRMFSTTCGFVAVLLFLTSPVFWYKGITIYGYLNAGFFILLTTFFCYRTIQGHMPSIYGAALSYALTVGVRPQDIMPMIPLFLYTLYHVDRRHQIRGGIVFGTICLVWLIPLVHISGGIQAYWALLQHGSQYLAENSIWGGNFFQQVNNHWMRLGQYFERSYFLGIFPLIYGMGRMFYLPHIRNQKAIQFLCVWILPQIIFNFFIQFAEIGHGLVWGLGGFVIIAQSIVILSEDFQIFWKQWIHDPILQKLFLYSVVFLICCINVIMFFHNFRYDIYNYNRIVYDDRQFNYADLKVLQNHLSSKIEAVQKNFGLQHQIMMVSNVFYSQFYYAFPKATVIRAENLIKERAPTIIQCHQWNCDTAHNRDTVKIPPGVKTLIVLDEPFHDFVSTPFKVSHIKISEHNQLTIVDISKARDIRFQFHKIEIRSGRRN